LINLTEIALSNLAHGTILVVDDDPAIIQVVYKLLGENYKVLMATNSEQAIKVCEKSMPDLVLLDVMMPGISGLETCQVMKNNPRLSNIPVIFMTSLQTQDDENECWQAGGVDFIQKPIKPMTLVNRVKTHIVNKYHADLLIKLAYTDGLTGISNRRYFDKRLEEQFALSKRNKNPLSLLLIDIDHFKNYNDSKGHLAGDDALCEVAKSIENCGQRPSDISARFGGEEFALILPDTNEQGAINVANNILKSIVTLNIDHPNSIEPYLTVSIGIASTVFESTNDFIDEADKQLYLSKQNGRNCFSISNQHTSAN
jgi:diguanylate cyclase (GGDEF)-like protein